MWCKRGGYEFCTSCSNLKNLEGDGVMCQPFLRDQKRLCNREIDINAILKQKATENKKVNNKPTSFRFKQAWGWGGTNDKNNKASKKNGWWGNSIANNKNQKESRPISNKGTTLPPPKVLTNGHVIAWERVGVE